jgi:hypothetical protein
MADIRKIKVDTFVQVIRKGKPNAKARVVGKTEKRVRVQIMDGNKYIKDANGNPVRTLVDPKNIKFYNKNTKDVPGPSTKAAAEKIAAVKAEATEAETTETTDEQE